MCSIASILRVTLASDSEPRREYSIDAGRAGGHRLHRCLDLTQATLEHRHRRQVCIDGIETGVQLCESPSLDPTLRAS